MPGEHGGDVASAGLDAAGLEPTRELSRVRLGPARPADDLEQHLDLERRLRDDRPQPFTTARELRRRASTWGGQVDVLVVDGLASQLPAFHQLEERVVDAHVEPRRELALRAARRGRLDEPPHRGLERPVAREADALVSPQAIGVELGNGAQRVVATGVRVARNIAERGEVAEGAAPRTRRQRLQELRHRHHGPTAEKATEVGCGGFGHGILAWHNSDSCVLTVPLQVPPGQASSQIFGRFCVVSSNAVAT